MCLNNVYWYSYTCIYTYTYTYKCTYKCNGCNYPYILGIIKLLTRAESENLTSTRASASRLIHKGLSATGLNPCYVASVAAVYGSCCHPKQMTEEKMQKSYQSGSCDSLVFLFLFLKQGLTI